MAFKEIVLMESSWMDCKDTYEERLWTEPLVVSQLQDSFYRLRISLRLMPQALEITESTWLLLLAQVRRSRIGTFIPSIPRNSTKLNVAQLSPILFCASPEDCYEFCRQHSIM